MLDLQRRHIQLFIFVIGLIALSMTAEKFREMLGEEASSKSGQFTFLNCFDMGSGSLACGAKEGVKLYVYNLRSAHVERVRQQAIEQALTEAISEGRAPADAAKLAQKVGAKSAKMASRQAKRILGPLISSVWDFFEAMYFGGSMTEGFLRGTGTLLGTYMGGFHGEQRVGGRIGYLMGSHIGSWIGARVGLMVYDVVNGVGYLVNFVQTEESYQSQSGYENEYKRDESSEESKYYERLDEETQESESYQSQSGYENEYKREESSEESKYYERPDEETQESEGFSLF